MDKLIKISTILITLLIFLLSVVLLNVDIVDNRDYNDDIFEVYLYDSYIGYLDIESADFNFCITGK